MIVNTIMDGSVTLGDTAWIYIVSFYNSLVVFLFLEGPVNWCPILVWVVGMEFVLNGLLSEVPEAPLLWSMNWRKTENHYSAYYFAPTVGYGWMIGYQDSSPSNLHQVTFLSSPSAALDNLLAHMDLVVNLMWVNCSCSYIMAGSRAWWANRVPVSPRGGKWKWIWKFLIAYLITVESQTKLSLESICTWTWHHVCLYLSHWDQVMNICVSNVGHHWFR